MPSDDLEPRVSALEAQVGKLTERVRSSEQDAAAARILAGAADRDVDEFRGEIRALRNEVRNDIQEVRNDAREFRRATTASFNALREDFTDLRRKVDNGFIEMRGKLDAAAAGQQRIVELIEGLNAKKD